MDEVDVVHDPEDKCPHSVEKCIERIRVLSRPEAGSVAVATRDELSKSIGVVAPAKEARSRPVRVYFHRDSVIRLAGPASLAELLERPPVEVFELTVGGHLDCVLKFMPK